MGKTFKVGDRVQFRDGCRNYNLGGGRVAGDTVYKVDKVEYWPSDKQFMVFLGGSCCYASRLKLVTETADAPTEAARRKAQPIARGVLDYFADALLAVAEVSRVGNEQHNEGQPMHWAYGKSADQADCLVRHLIDRGTLDTDGMSHTAKVAWRALALLQTELEASDPALHARRQAQRDAAAKGERT